MMDISIWSESIYDEVGGGDAMVAGDINYMQCQVYPDTGGWWMSVPRHQDIWIQAIKERVSLSVSSLCPWLLPTARELERKWGMLKDCNLTIVLPVAVMLETWRVSCSHTSA